jgi:hypothetical protein
VTVNAPRVLYLVISGAPAPEGLPSLVTLIQRSGWRVVVFSIPMGTRFADLDELKRQGSGGEYLILHGYNATDTCRGRQRSLSLC